MVTLQLSRRFHRVCCAHAFHTTSHKMPNTFLAYPLCLESKSQKALAAISHRKGWTMAPKSFAIARWLQQEDFVTWNAHLTVESNHAPYSKGETPTHLSFLWLLTCLLEEGRWKLFPDTTCDLCLFISVCWAEHTNMFPSFASGQRSSPHCHTLSPAEDSFRFCGGKNLNPTAWRSGKYSRRP